jgi:hypothetical protein
LTNLRQNDHQSGAAMVLVLTILAALLAGGAIALTLQRGSTQSSGLTASNRRSLYCAEAGLSAARQFVLVNTSNWDAMLDDVVGTSSTYDNNPEGFPIEGDIDDDGEVDYEVTVRDDDDDAVATTDVNGRIFLVSKCIKWPAYESEVLELIDVSGAANVCTNRLQKGGCASKGGNFNIQ